MKIILQTDRLRLRELTENDSAFIIELLNTEGWLKYIGNRNVSTEQEAKDYIVNGPVRSYRENGYGLCLVELKESNVPIGMCGIINRETLDHPDIGFAFLPAYYKCGFGYEIASKTLEYAGTVLGIQKICAITVPENTGSIRLLEKIGLRYQKMIRMREDDCDLMLFST